MNEPEDQPLPRSRRLLYGCGSCLLVLLVVGVVTAVTVGRAVRRSEALRSLLTPGRRPPAALSLPGGEARRLTAPDATLVMVHRWSAEGRYLLYSATPQPRTSQFVALATRTDPFTMQRHPQEIRQAVYRWFCPRLYLYDTATQTARELNLNTNLKPLPGGLCSLAPRANALTVELWDPAQADAPESSARAAAQYWAALDPAGRVGPLRKLGVTRPVRWHPSGTKLLYHVTERGPSRGTYLLDLKTGQRRRLAGTTLVTGLAWDADGQGFYYRRPEARANPQGLKWTLVHADLRTGARRSVPLRGGALRLGPLASDERLLLASGPAGAGGGSDLAAVTYRTGQVRWLRRGLRQVGSPTAVLLGGRIVALGEAGGATTDGHEASHPPVFLDTRTGKLHRPAFTAFGPDTLERWYPTPGGQGLLLQVRGHGLVGLNPFSLLREQLWLQNLTRPEELLSGPGE